MFSDHVSSLEFLLIMLLVRLNGQGHHGSDSKFTDLGNHLVETQLTVYSLLNAKKLVLMVGHMDNNQNQLHMFTYKFKMTQRHSDPVQVKTSAESNSPGPRGCHKVLASLYMGVFPYCAGPMFALSPKKEKKASNIPRKALPKRSIFE